ncbi:MAG: glycogen debranching N-terminal domain-containing protein, partial [Dehalococcoidia bacterium]
MNDNFPLRAQQGTFQLFRDQSLLVTAPDGEVRGDGIEGAYYANTRLLSRLALRVNGRPLTLVQAAPARDDLLVAYYHDPSVTQDDDYQDRALLVQLTVATGAGFHLDLDARNHSLAPIACDLDLLLAADFADLEEQRQGKRLQRGEVRRRCLLEESGEVRFDYLHPGLSEGAVLRFTPSPRCHDDGVRWRLDLPPQADWHGCVAIAPVHQGVEVTPAARCYGTDSDTAGEPPTWQERATRIDTSNDGVRRAYTRAVHDLAALALEQGSPVEQPAFAAGIPFYQNPFGRDLLTTSWQALLATPVLLESAILTCERTQGTTTDDFRDEQPGRIIQ